MLATIHQPNYLPWPGFFHKWMSADAFVILDTVQFHKNDWQNRNRIKTANGAQWLTVPVHYRFPAHINEVGIVEGTWLRKQSAALEQAYGKAPYFQYYWTDIHSTMMRPWQRLSDMNVALIHLLGGMLECVAPLHLASQMQTSDSDPTDRLIGLCREIGATGYLAGIDGKKYMQTGKFSEAGIDVCYQDVAAPVYDQLYGEFVSHLSVVDLLFNVGPEAPDVIRQMGGVIR